MNRMMNEPGAGALATRDLPVSVNTGEALTVNINIALAQFGQVIETLPPGFTYVSVAPGAGMEGVMAEEEDGVVTFTFPYFRWLPPGKAQGFI